MAGEDSQPAPLAGNVRMLVHGVVLSVLAERRLREGECAEVKLQLEDVLNPPIEQIGAMDIDYRALHHAHVHTQAAHPGRGITDVGGGVLGGRALWRATTSEPWPRKIDP